MNVDEQIITQLCAAAFYVFEGCFHALSSLGSATCVLSVFPYNVCYLDMCLFSLLPSDVPPVASHLSWGVERVLQRSQKQCWVGQKNGTLAAFQQFVPEWCLRSLKQHTTTTGSPSAHDSAWSLDALCSSAVCQVVPHPLHAASCSWLNTEAYACPGWIVSFSFSSLSWLFWSCPQLYLLFYPA